MPGLLYERDRGLNDREIIVGDDPLRVLQYVRQELPDRDVEGGNVGRVSRGGARGGKGVGENIAVFEICAVGEGFAFDQSIETHFVVALVGQCVLGKYSCFG